VTLDHIAAAIADEREQCEEKVRALLDASISLSEAEVLSAAENITDINRDARENVVALDALRVQFNDERGGGTLSGALEKQRRSLGAYVGAMNQGLTEQHESAARAIGCTNQITGLAQEIESISSALAVLTLNARIESARSGASGVAFGTIADSMRALSAQVKEANARVAELAASLKDIIPGIEARSRGLREQNGILAADITRQLGELGDAYTTARKAAAEVIVGGGEHARRVVARTNQVLSHLQYQDRMAQTLREVEAVLERSRLVELGMLENLPAEHDAGDVARALSEARARVPSGSRRFGGEGEPSSSAVQQESGEVMLF
jgi:chromosome segregation ATPase